MASELFDDAPSNGNDSVADTATATVKRGKSSATTDAVKASAASSTEPGGAVPMMASPTTDGEPVLPERVAEVSTGQGDIFAGEGLIFARYFTKPGEDVFDTTEWDYRTAIISGEAARSCLSRRMSKSPKHGQCSLPML